ncbi:MAG: YkgJ family cysteine cluster protein [Bacteriovorax sp.]|nr:YkgJ family cysteine cluster protein [Bacteriovorax sp.]
MNVPAIAKSTFELLRNQPEFLSITESVITHLNKIKSSLERTRFVHNMVDEYNKEIFLHPILKEMVPCKSGCTACCHTQVSVTEDEASLLLHNITNGVEIDYNLLSLQTEQGNVTKDFYKLAYKDRKCVFLDDTGECKVYNDRPSVCRTNAVVGDSAQCSTDGVEQGPIRLVKTSKADMVIVGAYAHATESGTLPMMLTKVLKDKHAKDNTSILKSLFDRIIGRKPVSKDYEL